MPLALVTTRSSSTPVGLFAQRGQASLVVEEMAQLLFKAQAAQLEIVPAPTWESISPTVRDTYRQHAEGALLRLDQAVHLRALAKIHRAFGDQGVAAVRAFDRTMLDAAPRVSAITGGSQR